MRRVEPAYPDLFPITHVLRPGHLLGTQVALEPIRMGVVWDNAPSRVLPAESNLPRHPVRALVFGRVARQRPDAVRRLLDRGSSVLMVLDDIKLEPAEVGLDGNGDESICSALLPVLPHPLADDLETPQAWQGRRWGAVLGLFPFPGAGAEVERRIEQLRRDGAAFAVAAPLLLTPKDRHRILDGCDGSGIEDRLENALFHADVGRGLHALERRAGVCLHAAGMESVIACMVPRGYHPLAVRSSAQLRLWARRLDQSHEQSSWGWRLRRAASALERLPIDPEVLADEDNLRIVPGFDPWVESFTRSLWHGGEPLESAWRRWAGLDGCEDCDDGSTDAADKP